MLRITVHEIQQARTLQLEGKLSGPWVNVLEECWQNCLACHRRPLLRVDLTAMTFIDEAGQACLAVMYREGAELITADAMTKAISAEITRGPPPVNKEVAFDLRAPETGKTVTSPTSAQ